MSPAPNSTLDDPQHIIADLQRANAELQRRLDESSAERDEALEQQTATAEVLGVINGSPGDLAPVFDAMLEKALRLCEASCGHFRTADGDVLHLVSARGVPEAYAEFLRTPVRPEPNNPLGRMLRGERVIAIADVSDEEPYRTGDPVRRAFVELGGARSSVNVALVKDDKLLGTLTVYRQEVRPFSEKQIALLKNFAAQAVIAMENARLLGELRERTRDLEESLEYQTATSDVLKVISRSTFDLQPVLDTLAETAARLCDAGYSAVFRRDGEVYRVSTVFAFLPETMEAARKFQAYLEHHPLIVDRGSVTGRAVLEGRAVQVADTASDPEYTINQATSLGNLHTQLGVPLLREGEPIGVIVVARQRVEPFTERQIELVRTFAAQAVIAMENARLITETREALEQQTATAEVLGVINSSPGDLAPVFDAILEKAHSLCGVATGALSLTDGGVARTMAIRGAPRAYAEAMGQPFRPPPESPIARIMQGAPFVQIPDMAELARENPDDSRGQAVAAAGLRTSLFLPLRREGEMIGYITAYRREVRPFASKEIALLQNFAAQAVIAIENARLLTETREALEQQTATAEVLQVINASPGDLAPVFDAMLQKAMQLCEAAFGGLWVFDGDRYVSAALRGVPTAYAEFLSGTTEMPGPGSAPYRFLDGERSAIQNIDLKAEELYRTGNAQRRALVDLGGARTALQVPLSRDDAPLGVITIYRQEVRPFTDKQSALLENFAAQAVIAMENARLITETREALEQQTATGEILRVVSGSQSHIQPVFEAIVESASKLCEAELSAVARYDGAQLDLVALNNMSPGEAAAFHSLFPRVPLPSFVMGRAVIDRRPVNVEDVLSEPGYDSRTRETLAGPWQYRSFLGVPILREGEPIGVIGCGRREVRPFTAKQIELVRTFADQAVIAIENARLITETREALEQQTATAEVLQVINSSPGALQPVFNAMLANVVRLCDCVIGGMFLYEDGGFRSVAMLNVTAEFAEIWRREAMRPAPTTALARMEQAKGVIKIDDFLESEGYLRREALHVATVEVFGARTVVAVPMLKEDELLGAIVVFRREPRSFTDKQLALVSNFASQAVIAIDNARLLNEIRQRQAELRVTFDNMGDGVAMFDADLRLAAWNMNFQRILELPDELLAARPSYADYIRLLAERGEFGTNDIEAELGSRLEHTDQELRLERTRPDGRVVEVRRNAVPGGGFVLIYSDVTERKRAEAELRAARDAAEAAYRDLKAAQTNLIQAEKMASLGQLTAGIAHEIKNPLNFVNNFAGLSVELLDELKETTAPAIATLDEDKRSEVDETIGLLTGNMEKIAEHGQRADNIVKSMLEHSRGVTGERREVDLNGLVDDALNLAYHGARAQDQSFNITLERDFDQALVQIELAPQEMTRVFLNLFGNGFYAATKRAREDGDASFRPILTVVTRNVGDTVEVRVRDNGTGIPPEIKDKLFQPFFTTKPTGEGTGLGLSISYDIVTQQHGGTIMVESEPGAFTEFTVRLPRQ